MLHIAPEPTGTQTSSVQERLCDFHIPKQQLHGRWLPSGPSGLPSGVHRLQSLDHFFISIGSLFYEQRLAGVADFVFLVYHYNGGIRRKVKRVVLAALSIQEDDVGEPEQVSQHSGYCPGYTYRHALVVAVDHKLEPRGFDPTVLQVFFDLPTYRMTPA
jgi:hypothetical protein